MSPATKKRQFVSGETLRANLSQFYERPVTRVSAELFFSIFAVIFFALFALRPTLNTMARLLREIEEKQELNAGLARKLSALSTAQNEYFTFADRFDILEEAVHSELSLEAALLYLEYLVDRENLSLAGLRIEEFPLELTPGEVEDAMEDREIAIYAVQATFTGTYDEIVRFFRAIESIQPLFSVQGFSFSVTEDRDGNRSLNANATIYMYGYQDEARVPGGNQ